MVRHELQGWSLLCNGIVVFDDLGELLPDATAVAPREVRRCPPALRPPVVVRSAETRS